MSGTFSGFTRTRIPGTPRGAVVLRASKAPRIKSRVLQVVRRDPKIGRNNRCPCGYCTSNWIDID